MMVGFFCRFAAAAIFSVALTACASGPDTGYANTTYSSRINPGSSSHLQCVPYARLHSGIQIHGDAWTWWNKAAGRYQRETQPSEGAVLVLYNYAGPRRAHLAVVRSRESDRIIRVDHANWFNDGAIYVDDPVQDVSPDNDWSQVRVWNIRTGAWGGRIYPVQGFIEATPDDGNMRVASGY